MLNGTSSRNLDYMFARVLLHDGKEITVADTHHDNTIASAYNKFNHALRSIAS